MIFDIDKIERKVLFMQRNLAKLLNHKKEFFI
ncbi:hypothetical protein U732_109 [Clostridium argentinense CDC 2741]|uniref:Uncharacterized protein n=1 Tax=Clostridium argentinense CDC 2741 TaxID=1418104 RepID=A0A0C1TWL6_9CLOT|nr:hypothetical protein U732_109 [Clostridium argentinense CDC 2741]